ncbi:MAG: orotidine-5'-phosphate decarboxylase [Candidatus Omnitrophica bacterium]|nr:orotidine-5'-phosphate decarboxylase [Candidatus Omnitrophota bacterium]
MEKGKLIVALDVETFDEARVLIDELKDVIDIYKIGSQLFTACGPVVVRYVLALGKQVFLDLKFHDIPNTVANAVSSAVKLPQAVHEAQNNIQPTQELLMCTLHILGGGEMLKQAVAAAKKQAQNMGVKQTLLVGITVLTSDENADNVRDLVIERAKLAKESGLDGIVASVQEAALIRKTFGPDFVIVTPGIRPAGADAGDQKRVATPAEAIRAGSNYLVVGRPIVKAENPRNAAKEILKQLKEA